MNSPSTSPLAPNNLGWLFSSADDSPSSPLSPHPALQPSILQDVTDGRTSIDCLHQACRPFFDFLENSVPLDQPQKDPLEHVTPLALDSAAATLSISQIACLVAYLQNDKQLLIPHTIQPNATAALQAISSHILSLLKTDFCAEKLENRCTVISAFSPDLHRNWLTDPDGLHKVLFCIERVSQTRFAIIALDSIASPTPRRFIQIVREQLLASNETLELLGLTSSLVRQTTFFGCGAFAVHDLMQYNRRPALFQEVSSLPYLNCGQDWTITLPPDLMEGTQSIKTLISYIQQLPLENALANKVKRLYQKVAVYAVGPSDTEEDNLYIAKLLTIFQQHVANGNAEQQAV